MLEETGDGLTGERRADRQDGAERFRAPDQIVDGSDDSRLQDRHTLKVGGGGVVIDESGKVGHAAKALERLDDAEDLTAEASGPDDEERSGHALSLCLSMPRNSDIVASPTAEMP